LGAYAAVFVFMVQTGLDCPARYLAPFYVLLLAPLLAGNVPARMTRNVFWRGASVGVFLLAAGLLILSPCVHCDRPSPSCARLARIILRFHR
jgi:hypothetical protein